MKGMIRKERPKIPKTRVYAAQSQSDRFLMVEQDHQEDRFLDSKMCKRCPRKGKGLRVILASRLRLKNESLK